jgi:GNAT superfamily N-acetyltransferase
MIMEIIYRKADPSDFLEVAALDREAWKQNRNSQYIPDGEHVWRIWLEHALAYTAKENGKVAGAIVAFPCISGQWFVHKVFVDLEIRGRGIGTRLFEILLSQIDEIKADCFLTVDPAYGDTIRFYETLGFIDKIFFPGYYRSNEDRFVLTRRWRS